jgi:sulfatase maturation enzyme AslB (radical SAM superfamily)
MNISGVEFVLSRIDQSQICCEFLKGLFCIGVSLDDGIEAILDYFRFAVTGISYFRLIMI